MITGAVVKRAWCHSLARIRRMCSAIVSHETRQSSARILPLEIVEIIIAQLIYDIQSLRACSLTCYSWYIAAVPHLHYTFIAPIRYNRREDPKFGWSGPLPNMHKLGLLPLVKKFQICRTAINDFQVFSPKRFNRRILYHFTALTNVQDLRIDYLDIASFMPKIQPYFGHFLPSVRSLALRAPKGSRRQIIYFIGLFQYLDDLKLIYDRRNPQDEPIDNPTLVPSFAPPLRGRLKLTDFTMVGLLKDMIDLFGRIRFRHMDLCDVNGVGLLLGACADTLETLRLYPADPRGKERSLNSVEVQADNSQLYPPLGTLIYHGTSRFGHSRSQRAMLRLHCRAAHQILLWVSSHMHC